MGTLSARTYQISVSPIRAMLLLAEGTEGLIRLDAGEPDFNTPEPIIRAAQQALDDGWTKYTGSPGIMPLRKALAEYDAPKLGRMPDAAREVCVTMGGTNSLYLSFLALLNPGDEVLIPDPGWPQYGGVVRLAAGVPVPYTLDPNDGFRLDRDSVLACISPRTKAILINSPNNPTGSVLDLDDLEFFARTARERDIWIVTDEVYEHIVFDGLKHYSIAALPDMAERTVVIGAFSKTFSMTGWRLGHLVGPASIVDAVIRFQGFVNTCPNAAAQIAGLAALKLPDESVDWMVGEFQTRRDFFLEELSRIPGLECRRPSGAFYMFVDASSYGVPDDELSRYLLQTARVCSIPGSSFGQHGRGYLRFSCACSQEVIRTGLSQIGTALAGLPAALQPVG